MTSSMPSSSSSSSSSPSTPYAYAKEICNQVLQLDKSIRFADIANNMGTLIAYKMREGLVPLLNEEELPVYITHAEKFELKPFAILCPFLSISTRASNTNFHK